LRRTVIIAGVVCLIGLLPAAGRATYPGGNGLIAFTNVHSEDIFLMNADGSLPGPFLADPKLYEDDPSWSADGGRLVFVTTRLSDDNPDYDIEVIGTDGTGRLALTDTGDDERYPVFSPDGTQIAFIKRAGGASNLFVMNSDGSDVQRLTDTGDADGPIDWSPDGAAIAFTLENDFGQHIAAYNVATETVTPLTLVGDQEDASPSYSPNGTQIAYHRTFLLGDDPTIRVMNVNGTGDHAVPSANPSADEVTWSPDGSVLLIQEDPDNPRTVLVDPAEVNRTVISNDYAANLAWQPCPDPACSLAPPRDSITQVTLAVRDGRDLNVFTEVYPIREGDPVLVTLFHKGIGDRKFKEVGTLATTINDDGVAKATFRIGRKGQCKARTKYLESDDYLPSKDKGQFSCKGGLAN
jgi:Tol biopolymer transport system component